MAVQQERYHWKEAITTVFSFLIGFQIVSASWGDGRFATLAGLALMGLSIYAFVVTRGWRHTPNLPTGAKVFAYIPVAVGGLLPALMFGPFVRIDETISKETN
jgi:hypothetical protein